MESAVVHGGRHWRLTTPNGRIHVWLPDGPPPLLTVIYVHGYYTTADEAWKKNSLPEQFAASGVRALFIVPEAPSKKGQKVRFPQLDRLLQTVTNVTQVPSYVAAIGHSAGYMTIASWLNDPSLRHIVLLDALYAKVREFAKWIRHPAHSMELAASTDTPISNSRDFVKKADGWHVKYTEHAHLGHYGWLKDLKRFIKAIPVPGLPDFLPFLAIGLILSIVGFYMLR